MLKIALFFNTFSPLLAHSVVCAVLLGQENQISIFIWKYSSLVINASSFSPTGIRKIPVP